MSSFHFYYGITSVGVEEPIMDMPPEAQEPYLFGRAYGYLEVAITALADTPFLLRDSSPGAESLKAARQAREQMIKFAKLKGWIDS